MSFVRPVPNETFTNPLRPSISERRSAKKRKRKSGDKAKRTLMQSLTNLGDFY